jgi:hypothetical protein
MKSLKTGAFSFRTAVPAASVPPTSRYFANKHNFHTSFLEHYGLEHYILLSGFYAASALQWVWMSINKGCKKKIKITVSVVR